MADPRLPLSVNMEPQAEEPRMEEENTRTETVKEIKKEGPDQDQGTASSTTGATGNTSTSDPNVGGTEGGAEGGAEGEADWEGEDDEYCDEFGPYYPYPGILALTEIGIRDSREMIHTALGLGRYLHQCTCKDIFTGVLVTLCFFTVFTVTVMRLAMFDLFGNADITADIAIIMNVWFLLYYMYSGIFFERPYEIAATIFSTMFLWILIATNYALSIQGYFKMIRIIVVSAFGPWICVTCCAIIRSYVITNSVVYRICGSNKALQERCRVLFQYLALIKIDFQTQITLAVLVMKDGLNLGVLEWFFLIFMSGLAIASAVLGYGMVRYENHRMTLAFSVLWLFMPGCCIYLIIKAAIWVQARGHTEEQQGLTAVVFLSVIFCLCTRVGVFYYVLKVFLNYGVGLRQKAFEGYIDEENRERHDPEDLLPWRGFDYRYYQNPMPSHYRRRRPKAPRPINT